MKLTENSLYVAIRATGSGAKPTIVQMLIYACYCPSSGSSGSGGGVILLIIYVQEPQNGRVATWIMWRSGQDIQLMYSRECRRPDPAPAAFMPAQPPIKASFVYLPGLSGIWYRDIMNRKRREEGQYE